MSRPSSRKSKTPVKGKPKPVTEKPKAASDDSTTKQEPGPPELPPVIMAAWLHCYQSIRFLTRKATGMSGEEMDMAGQQAQIFMDYVKDGTLPATAVTVTPPPADAPDSGETKK